MLRAAISSLSADRNTELSNAIKGLHHQIPMTVGELRETISHNTDNIVSFAK